MTGRGHCVQEEIRIRIGKRRPGQAFLQPTSAPWGQTPDGSSEPVQVCKNLQSHGKRSTGEQSRPHCVRTEHRTP